MTLEVVTAVLLGVLLDRTVVRPSARWLKGRLSGRLVGRLPRVYVPTAEASRSARLEQLGEAGIYRVYNCGTILHVDYARGELIIEREGTSRHFLREQSLGARSKEQG